MPTQSIPERTLKVASFDSGGPRSYSQLKILKDFMHRVQWDKYPDEPDKVVLPSEYFHLIGGSDMGGLIAIMFAKLHMSVEDAITELSNIVESVYEREIEPKKRTERLKNHMESLLIKRGFSPDLKLEAEQVEGCVGFVLATLSLNSTDSVYLRTYHVATDPPTGITVVDAALATCAFPSEFLPVSVGTGYEKLEYVSAGLRASNPIRQVITETYSYFGGDSRIGLLLSIGSGHPGTLSLTEDDSSDALGQLMRGVLLDCEKQAQEVQQWMGKFDIYFRFSVEQGMQNTPTLAGELGWISAQTSGYLSQPDTIKRVDKCLEETRMEEGAITLKVLLSLVGSVNKCSKPRELVKLSLQGPPQATAQHSEGRVLAPNDQQTCNECLASNVGRQLPDGGNVQTSLNTEIRKAHDAVCTTKSRPSESDNKCSIKPFYSWCSRAMYGPGNHIKLGLNRTPCSWWTFGISILGIGITGHAITRLLQR